MQPLGLRGGVERGSRLNQRGTPLGTSVNLAAGIHGLQNRGRRREGRPEGHQTPHV